MIQFKVGCNFDPELLDGLNEINETLSHHPVGVIRELYGSLPDVNPIGTARPAFRLRSGSEQMLSDYVARARGFGMGINYTLNASMVDPRKLKEREKDIRDFLEFLELIGVVRVTVAHPLVAQLVNEQSSLPIELSTIMQIRHPRQLEQLKARYQSVQKLCLDVFANRDEQLLLELGGCARDLGITLEAIVNEFCLHECADRNFCYDLHSLDMTRDETKLFGHYPMGHCIRTRIMSPVEWLHARFILPQWVRTYRDKFGIESFKITGRTHPTPYILKVAGAYMSGRWDGNLLELWADVENIARAESEYRSPRIDLSCAKMPEDFLRFYFRRTDGIPPPSSKEESLHLARVFEQVAS